MTRLILLALGVLLFVAAGSFAVRPRNHEAAPTAPPVVDVAEDSDSESQAPSPDDQSLEYLKQLDAQFNGN